MQTLQGKMIVLDGLDGSGKSTQFEMVDRELERLGLPHLAISFPDYQKPSSALVRMYLDGEFSKSPDDVNAYAASSFYAVDRYASYKLYWESAYQEGSLILSSRYTTSNAIHQMGKLPVEEWRSFLLWLQEYEYDRLGLPRPDRVIFLDMPLEVSQDLLMRRYQGKEERKDIHEADRSYLARCRQSALFAASEMGWNLISCAEEGRLLSKERIFEKIMVIVNEVIGC